jgi:hypothetical protein
MNKHAIRTAFTIIPLLAGIILSQPAESRAAEATVPGRGDLIRFRSGDSLYGKLRAFDATNGLRWIHPDAVAPIAFKPGNVVEVQLAEKSAAAVSASNTCLIRLGNQDEITGGLVSFDAEKMIVETSQAGRLTLPRKTVQFIQPRPAPAPPIFEGPTGLEGWTIGKVSNAAAEAGEWRYRNGAFYATRAASIARDIRLPDVASLEFDLAWRGSFHLALALYTDYLQPISLATKETEPDFGGFYSLQLNNYYANLLAVTKPDPLRYLGQMPLQPDFGRKNAAHVEVRINKAKNIVALLIDGVLIKSWVDTQEFVGRGTGIRIVHQGQGGSRISGLRVSEWDGQFEEKPTNPPDSRQDLAKLRNGDRLQGALEQIRDGKMLFAISGRTIEVPLNRVKQIEMAGAGVERPKPSEGSVRAHFHRGGSVTLDLEKVDDAGWVTRSPAFGAATFQRDSFSRIQFDLRGSTE